MSRGSFLSEAAATILDLLSHHILWSPGCFTQHIVPHLYIRVECFWLDCCWLAVVSHIRFFFRLLSPCTACGALQSCQRRKDKAGLDVVGVSLGWGQQCVPHPAKYIALGERKKRICLFRFTTTKVPLSKTVCSKPNLNFSWLEVSRVVQILRLFLFDLLITFWCKYLKLPVAGMLS